MHVRKISVSLYISMKLKISPFRRVGGMCCYSLDLTICIVSCTRAVNHFGDLESWAPVSQFGEVERR